ncbi:MAG: hypothetical protein ACJ71W_05660 [Terriglobales bacterium]
MKIVGAILAGITLVVGLIMIVQMSLYREYVLEHPIIAASSTKLALQPTQEELVKAQRAGLSKEFAVDAWVAHIHTVSTHTRLVGIETDSALPSDEAIRDELKATKKSVQTPADQLAFERMYALLWIDHTAPHFKMKGENAAYEGNRDAGYGRYTSAGEDCFSAVMSSFGNPSFSEYPADVQKGIRNCLPGQRKLKAAIDRVRIVKWDEF